ncbi:MAG TPA: hypothetical protein VMM80_11320 [Bacteroidota bacterium]|nr:hypothetical protein [Bacteroidota bacterium]
MDHPDFRVGATKGKAGKIFATLAPPVPPTREALRVGRGTTRRPTQPKSEPLGMVKLTPAQQSAFIKSNPAAFFPCQGAWGKAGATYIRLSKITRPILLRALAAAWENTAPKSLLQAAPPPSVKPGKM